MDDEATKLRAFPLVIKGEVGTWFNGLADERKGIWEALKGAFLQRFGAGETPEKLWQQLSELRQSSLYEYTTYEARFQDLWARWTASLGRGEVAPNFLKDKFLTGLHSPLQEKVRGRFPAMFEEVVDIAHEKDRKIRYQHQVSQVTARRAEEGVLPLPVEERGQQRMPPTQPPNEDAQQQDLLQRIRESVRPFGSRGQDATTGSKSKPRAKKTDKRVFLLHLRGDGARHVLLPTSSKEFWESEASTTTSITTKG